MDMELTLGTRRENLWIALGASTALFISFAALFYGGAFGPDIVKSILVGTGIAEGGVAIAIVDAVIAGSTVAAAVGAVLGLGIGGAAMASISWAIRTFGRKKSIE